MTHYQPAQKMDEIDPMTRKRRQYNREKLSGGAPKKKERKKNKQYKGSRGVFTQSFFLGIFQFKHN